MLFVLLLVALAVVARAADVRMEPSVNTFSSSKWMKEKSLNENDIIKTTFVLKHDKSKVAAFEKTLLDLSTPTSKNYGKWLKVRIIFQFRCYFFYLHLVIFLNSFILD